MKHLIILFIFLFSNISSFAQEPEDFVPPAEMPEGVGAPVMGMPGSQPGQDIPQVPTAPPSAIPAMPQTMMPQNSGPIQSPPPASPVSPAPITKNSATEPKGIIIEMKKTTVLASEVSPSCKDFSKKLSSCQATSCVIQRTENNEMLEFSYTIVGREKGKCKIHTGQRLVGSTDAYLKPVTCKFNSTQVSQYKKYLHYALGGAAYEIEESPCIQTIGINEFQSAGSCEIKINGTDKLIAVQSLGLLWKQCLAQ